MQGGWHRQARRSRYKLANVLLSGSCLRQAWRSLKRARDSEDVIKRAGQDTMDMDDLLAASVFDDIEARHWARYKMTWPPEIALPMR